MKRYNGVMIVTESWFAPLTMGPEGYPIRGRDHADKGEGLIIEVECADGTRATATALFERDEEGNVTFKEPGTDFDRTSPAGFLTAVRQVWQTWGGSV